MGLDISAERAERQRKEVRADKKRGKEIQATSQQHGVPVKISGYMGTLCFLLMVVGVISLFYGALKIFLEFTDNGSFSIEPETFIGLLFIAMGAALFFVGNKYRSQYSADTDSSLGKINQYCTENKWIGPAALASPVLLICIVSIPVFFPQTESTVNAHKPAKKKTVQDLAIEAFVQCQGHVENKLKAPASAKFPFLDFKPLMSANNVFTIQSYVDSQNSFGAMLRTNWICRIQQNGKSWELVDVQFHK